jgi:hypothetical protein
MKRNETMAKVVLAAFFLVSLGVAAQAQLGPNSCVRSMGQVCCSHCDSQGRCWYVCR